MNQGAIGLKHNTANALGCGYWLIDTANAYMNEKAVGRGMRESGVKRDEIYKALALLL